MNITEILQQRAQRHSDLPAIIDTHRGKPRVTTFAELENGSRKIGFRLQQQGLQSGDTVLVFYPMSADLYITLGAIFRLGMTAMFLDPSAGREHLESCCRLHPPQALIASPKAHLLRLISSELRKIPHKFVIGGYVPGARKIDFTAELNVTENAMTQPVSEQSPALITFTSGSTGQPKAALRSHGFLVAQHNVLHRNLALTEGETDLTTLPVFVLANLASGVTSLIPQADLRFPGSIDPAPIVGQIQNYQLHSTAASPAFLEKIADYCLAKNILLTSWQKVFTGGAPVFPRLSAKLQRIAPQAKIVAVYGSTEAEPIAEMTYDKITLPEINSMQQGSGLLAGTPVKEIELRIILDQWGGMISSLTLAEFEKMELAPNKIGEIVVSGAHVLPGYLHGLGDEETKFRVAEKNWHRTGDAGYLDEAGKLWLLGRCAAKISDVRGELYPFAVECAAVSDPNVKRAALIQQEGKRLLVIERISDRKEIKCQALQASLIWAQLDEIRIVGQIPVDKRHNAKVDYVALKEVL
jgi:olefin beta-lactone synthetase